MPRTTRKDKLQEKQDPKAMDLFDLDGFPCRPDWVQSVQAQSYKHTGARLTEDDGKCLRLVELLMQQWGIKRIARDLRVSPLTVRAARDVLVAAGRLEPYKQRIVRIYEDIVEAGALYLRDAMEDRLLPASQVGVNLGIIHDKRAQALGEATSVSVGVRVEPRAERLSVEALNAWATECQSTVVPSICEGNEGARATLSVTTPLGDGGVGGGVWGVWGGETARLIRFGQMDL